MNKMKFFPFFFILLTLLENLKAEIPSAQQRIQESYAICLPEDVPNQNNECNRLFVSSEALYWQADEDGLFYCSANKNMEFVFFADVNDNAKIANPHFKWDWGYRINAGFFLPDDVYPNWDISASWLYFCGHAEGHKKAGPGGVLFPIWQNIEQLAAQTAELADAHWRLHLHLLDIELGQKFAASPTISMRPHFGIRNAWIDQKYIVRYGEAISAYLSVPPLPLNPIGPLNYKRKMNSDYQGIGLEGGIQTFWGFNKEWCLFGNIAGSVLFGHFFLREHEAIVQPIKKLTENVKNHEKASQTIAEFSMGIKWNHCFEKNGTELAIYCSWEQHIFFGQNQLSRPSDDVVQGPLIDNQGDLSLKGISLGAQLSF